MRILVASFWCPFPPDNGSRLRAYHLIRQLARQGHQLRLLTLTQPETDLQAAREAMAALCTGGVEFFPSRLVFRPHTARALIGFLTPRPRHLLELFQPDFAAAVAQECHSGGFDAVLALELGTAHYVPADAPIPCVLDQLEVSPFQKAVLEAPSPRERLRRSLTLIKLRVHIRDLGRRYALWTAVSEAEVQAIKSLAGNAAPPLEVLANGVDLEGNAYAPEAAYENNTLVYNGALSFSANEDAVRWFAAEILPILQQSVPSLRLRVTGRNDGLVAADPLRAMPGVTLTGFLQDVRPAIQSALACVVPLRQGGGTRLKILEAMALGVPVVATSRGAEGITATPGRDILIADTPAAFAEAVLSLRNDPARRASLGAAGRCLVEAHYGWDALGSQLDRSLCALVQGRK